MTSPPYYGLRSYAGEQVVEWPFVVYRLNEFTEPQQEPMRCARALSRRQWRTSVTGILCLREWRWVLRDDGCILLTLATVMRGSGAGGDYSSGGLREGQPSGSHNSRQVTPSSPKTSWASVDVRIRRRARDGWYLQQRDHPSQTPMPRERGHWPTKAHEQVFFAGEVEQVFWDADAVRENSVKVPPVQHSQTGKRASMVVWACQPE